MDINSSIIVVNYMDLWSEFCWTSLCEGLREHQTVKNLFGSNLFKENVSNFETGVEYHLHVNSDTIGSNLFKENLSNFKTGVEFHLHANSDTISAPISKAKFMKGMDAYQPCYTGQYTVSHLLIQN